MTEKPITGVTAVAAVNGVTGVAVVTGNAGVVGVTAVAGVASVAGVTIREQMNEKRRHRDRNECQGCDGVPGHVTSGREQTR